AVAAGEDATGAAVGDLPALEGGVAVGAGRHAGGRRHPGVHRRRRLAPVGRGAGVGTCPGVDVRAGVEVRAGVDGRARVRFGDAGVLRGRDAPTVVAELVAVPRVGDPGVIGRGRQ